MLVIRLGGGLVSSLLLVLLLEEALVDLVQEVKLELFELILLDEVLGRLLGSSGSTDETLVSECLLEEGHLLLENRVLRLKLGISLEKMVVGDSKFVNLSLVLINEILQLFLIGLLALSRSDSRLSVLEPLSGFLVLNWVIKIVV